MDNWNPKVSILIRTYQRPQKLIRAIKSVIEQTYKNIEIVVVEDGKAISKDIIAEYFHGINIKYTCMDDHVGRSATGNRALELSSGEYCCFLDDDDYLYKNHIELLVSKIGMANCRMVYSWAEEKQVDKKGRVRRKFVCYRFKPNRLLLCEQNYLPIQSVLFARSLYIESGGFDCELNELEDWDLWLRYITKTDLAYVPQVTSCYHTPYNNDDMRKRREKLLSAEEKLKIKKREYKISLNQDEIRNELAYIRSYNDSIFGKVKRILQRILY